MLRQRLGDVGVPHGVEFDGQRLFFSGKGLLGGPAPVRRFLPHLMDLVPTRRIDAGKVSDVAEGGRAMDERRAIKTLLRVRSQPERPRAGHDEPPFGLDES